MGSSKLPIRSVVLASLVAAVGLIAAGAATKTPDAKTPAEETECDSLRGASFGLCTAYCEAMDCDSDAPKAKPAACLRVLKKFRKVSEDASPPCFDGDGDGVLDGEDNCPFVANDQTNSDALPAGDACQCGDVNNDGVVDGTDVIRAQENLVGATLSGAFFAKRCNVIGPSDGGVTDCDVSDIFVLQRFVSGQPVTLENVCAAYFGP